MGLESFRDRQRINYDSEFPCCKILKKHPQRKVPLGKYLEAGKFVKLNNAAHRVGLTLLSVAADCSSSKAGLIVDFSLNVTDQF